MKFGRKFAGWLLLVFSIFTGCSDSGETLGTTKVSNTVLTTTSSSEESSSSSEGASTSSDISATVAGTDQAEKEPSVQTGKLIGDGSVVYRQYLGGIIGKRPASGVVTDQKIDNADYDFIMEFAPDCGFEAIYRIPQFNIKSDAARSFNDYMKQRAEIDLVSVASDIKNNAQGLKEGNITGWIYFDYAVVETQRYISIILFKLNEMWSSTPHFHIEAFVYDKETRKILKMTDLFDDFGVAREDGLTGLEALYPKHNIELKNGDSGYTYMQEYVVYLDRLWQDFFGADSVNDGRGRQDFFHIEGYDFNFYPSCALYVADEDGKDVLRVIHRDAKMSGVNESTGNIAYERKILDEPFEAIQSDVRKVNKAFDALAPDAPADVLGVLVYLGNAASPETVGKFASLYEADPELGLSFVTTGRDKEVLCALIPHYEGSTIRINDANDRNIVTYSAPTALVFGGTASPIRITLTAREEWTMFEIPLDRTELNLSASKILDATDSVMQIETENSNKILELLKYYFR